MRHPALLSARESVLVVIDPQTRLMPVIHEEARIVQNMALLVQSAQILDIPVLATTQYAARLGDIVPSLANLISTITIYDKMCFSAGQCAPFCDTLKTLKANNRSQVVLCGVETHICILQTAADLSAQGYSVQVAVDAVSSRTENTHQAGLARLSALSILLPPTESVVYEWLEEAGTVAFKQILPLVK
jgi:nicotinamidase-related amidase